MNRNIVAFVLTLGLMTAGMLMFEVFAQENLTGDVTMTIPEGASNYSYVEIEMPEGGPVSGTYECLSGGEIMVMVLDGGQFDRFVGGQDHGSRFSGTGSSGSISVKHADMERCYIVLFHSGGASAQQNVRVTYDVDTIDSERALIGAALLVGGLAAMVGFGFVEMKRRKAITPPPKHIDVLLFDEKVQ